MATGFQSNYNDSGYVVPTSGVFYNQNNNEITASSFLSSDIYNSTQQVGIYMLNGTQGTNSGSIYPIFCSLTNMNNLAIPNDQDDAWLVYPGYGFRLFNNTNYVTDNINSTVTYINVSNRPVIFYSSGGGYNTGTVLKNANNNNYPNNVTASVKIYYRFQEITIPGLS